MIFLSCPQTLSLLLTHFRTSAVQQICDQTKIKKNLAERVNRKDKQTKNLDNYVLEKYRKQFFEKKEKSKKIKLF